MKINDFSSVCTHRYIQTNFLPTFSSYRNFLMFFIQVRYVFVLEMECLSVFLSIFHTFYSIQIHTVPLFFIHKLFEPFFTDKGKRQLGEGGCYLLKCCVHTFIFGNKMLNVIIFRNVLIKLEFTKIQWLNYCFIVQ